MKQNENWCLNQQYEFAGVIVKEYISSMLDGDVFTADGNNFNMGKRKKYQICDRNNNEFYSNCTSLKEAHELINELAKVGKKAVIGLRAPLDLEGNLSFKEEKGYGVYIIVPLENDLDSSKTR